MIHKNLSVDSLRHIHFGSLFYLQSFGYCCALIQPSYQLCFVDFKGLLIDVYGGYKHCFMLACYKSTMCHLRFAKTKKAAGRALRQIALAAGMHAGTAGKHAG